MARVTRLPVETAARDRRSAIAAVKYVECRDLRHAWETESLEQVDRTHVQRLLRCLRCDTTRSETVNVMTGTRVERIRYPYYPDGYKTKGVGRVAPDEWRAEALRRLMAQTKTATARR